MRFGSSAAGSTPRRGLVSGSPWTKTGSMPSVPAEPPRISREEYSERQHRARELAERAGASGVVVIGRGGGTYDRHGDLWYLTGHYQTFPYLHDRPPLWSGRAHAVLVLPVEGESLLICSA